VKFISFVIVKGSAAFSAQEQWQGVWEVSISPSGNISSIKAGHFVDSEKEAIA
jgi:hypothetical protein